MKTDEVAHNMTAKINVNVIHNVKLQYILKKSYPTITYVSTTYLSVSTSNYLFSMTRQLVDA